MPPQAWRAVALALLLVSALPSALAQVDPSDPLNETRPDLIPTHPVVETRDERTPTRICIDVLNAGDGQSAFPFHVLLRLDGADRTEHRVTATWRQGEGTTEPLCWEVQLAAGVHNYSILVDSHNEVAETDEANNLLRERSFRVAPTPVMDLRLARLDVLPKVGRPNENQIFVATVLNAGGLATPATNVTITDDAGMSVTLPVRALGPGQEWQVAHATRPDLRPAGTWVARAVVDPHDAVREVDELDNDAHAEYEILEHPAADLVLENVTVSGNLTARRGFRIEADMPNIGDRLAVEPVARLLNEDNVSLGNVTRSLLSPGRSMGIELFLTLPPGHHTLRLVADPDGRIVERDEANNVAWINVTIEAPPWEHPTPNLVVQRIDLAPSDPAPGDAVMITVTVRNVGDNRSAGTTVNLTLGESVLASVPISALPPGAYATATAIWKGGPTALYRVGAHVDPLGRIEELDEADNRLGRELAVYARPPPEAPAEPTPPAAGDAGNATAPPATNATPDEADPTAPVAGARVEVADLLISTRPVPGGVKGTLIATIRNPNAAPLGRLSVTYSVDGETIKEVLLQGVLGAGTGSATSGEVDLPAGNHTVRVEVRLLGSNEPPASITRTYEAEAGERQFGLPAPGGVTGALAVAAAAALAARARRGRLT